MAHIIDLKTSVDSRGILTVIEKVLPFEIKRVFYIYGVNDPSVVRGGHRHKKTIQALVAVSGSCEVFSNNGVESGNFTLTNPGRCLILRPEDWHTMQNFTKDCVLVVLASEYYDQGDYVKEGYR